MVALVDHDSDLIQVEKGFVLQFVAAGVEQLGGVAIILVICSSASRQSV